jgi:uncharacterized protein YqeY
MTLKEQINEAVKNALKAGDEMRKKTLRMVQAGIKQVEVDKRIELDDEAVMAILQREIKLRKEALDEAVGAKREDLAADARVEIDILKEFLPKSLSAEELQSIVMAVITETGAAGIVDMGKVMKGVMPKVAGKATGDEISSMVKSLLAPQ